MSGCSKRTGSMVALLLGLVCLAYGTPSTAAPAAPPPKKRPAVSRLAPRTSTPASPVPELAKPWTVGVSALRRAKALQLFRRGNAHFRGARFAAALARYRQAVKLWDHPSIRFNMAVCYMHRDQHLLAWRAFVAALRYGRGPFSVERYLRAQTYQKLLLGHLAIVGVSCRVPGAEVILDGERIIRGPGRSRRAVVPGEHLVVASRRGYITSRQRLRLGSGTQTVVKMHLLPIHAAFTVQRRWSRFMPWAVLGAGAAVGLVGLGLLLGGNAGIARYNRRFSEACPDGCVSYDPTASEEVGQIPSSLVSLERRALAERQSGIALLAAGGAAAFTGFVLVLLNWPHQVERLPQNEVRGGRLLVTPHLGPKGAGLSARFRF